MGWELGVYRSRHWENLSKFVRFERARGYCEECGVAHGTVGEDGRTVVYLTCAHLNGESRDLRLSNLRALCPRCHTRLDEVRRKREREAAARAEWRRLSH
jgi:5-methylcytosine-specific restriction endonuclease McrA